MESEALIEYVIDGLVLRKIGEGLLGCHVCQVLAKIRMND